MSQACLFCGADGPGIFTNEHVIPQWLMAYLGLPDDDKIIQGVANAETGALVKPPRIHATSSFVHGRVCEGCNNGWMSRLEDVAKPPLIALMEGRSLRTLSASEAGVVGKWAAKTAYLHTWMGLLKEPAPLAHLRALHGDEGKVPDRVGVFGMYGDYKQPSGYIQSGHWPQLGVAQTTKDGETPEGAYKIGLQFRGLYLLVAFWPDPTSLLTRLRAMHIRILMIGQQPDPSYAKRVIIGGGPIDRLVVFADWLAVMHPVMSDD